MSTIMPEGELKRKAVTWISQEREASPKPIKALVEEACIRFNLGPKDEEYLIKFFAEQDENKG